LYFFIQFEQNLPILSSNNAFKSSWSSPSDFASVGGFLPPGGGGGACPGGGGGCPPGAGVVVG